MDDNDILLIVTAFTTYSCPISFFSIFEPNQNYLIKILHHTQKPRA